MDAQGHSGDCMIRQAPHLPVSAEDVRSLGYRMVDILVRELSEPRARPIYPELRTSQEMEVAFGGPMPLDPVDPRTLLDRIERELIPASANFLHPGIMAWVAATPQALPGLVDGLLCALRIFPHAWKLTPGSIQVELTVCRWLGEMVGFGDGATGHFTTGGTVANLYALAAARTRAAGLDLRMKGMRAGTQLVAYASEHAHICIEQSIALLGIGTENLRRIPLDSRHQMRTDALEHALREDVRAGRRPFCIVATAGTTDTGAVDPIEAISAVAKEYGIWLHVDGSYGALAASVDACKPLFRGLSQADSVSIDPHKWLNIPFEAGCVLVRRPADLPDTFRTTAPYLESGASADAHDHWQSGFELSRSDRAAKVWFALSQHGVRAYRCMIEDHLEFARRLHRLVRDDPEFEPLHEPSLSVLCIRYIPRVALSDERIDVINQQIEDGFRFVDNALVAGTSIGGRRALRFCFVNHRTAWSDVEAALATARHLGRSFSDSMP